MQLPERHITSSTILEEVANQGFTRRSGWSLDDGARWSQVHGATGDLVGACSWRPTNRSHDYDYSCDVDANGDVLTVDAVGDFRRPRGGAAASNWGTGTFLCELPAGLDPSVTTLVTADGSQEVLLADLVACEDYGG